MVDKCPPYGADICPPEIDIEKAFWNVLKLFVLPRLLKGSTGDTELHNTTNALMQTLDIKGLSE